MGKHSKSHKRADTIKWLKGDISESTMGDVRKALAEYCHEEQINLRGKGKPAVTLKLLLPILRSYDVRW